MSSPFQQKFMAKNPVKGFTMDQLEKSTKKAEKQMKKSAAILPQVEGPGNPDYESKDEQRFAGDDGYDGSVEKTQVSNGSVAQMASPLNAYVSTAGHFQRLQDNIARAFTPTKGNKADYDATEENKEYLEPEEQTAASKVITGDGFGNRSGSKPIAIEDIDVYDESDLEFDNY